MTLAQCSCVLHFAKMCRTVHLRSLIVLSVALLIRDVDAERRILPTSVEVQEGQDVQVQLLQILKDETSCYVRTPLLNTCNLKVAGSEKNASCDDRMYYWPVNGACGFYVKNVQKQDHGFWRLISQNENSKVVDVVMITVLDQFDASAESLEITKGMTYTLTFSDINEYCIVRNPHEPFSVIVNNVCGVEIEKVSTVDHGNWSAIIGVRGRIEETMKMINVSVFSEHVSSGYTISVDPEAVHLYCNYQALDKHLTLCRFTKSSVDQVGFRLREGMRKGRYEYYGSGLDAGECGLTIQSPEEKDYGLWYCLINTPNKSPIVTAIMVSRTFAKRAADSITLSTATSPVITTEGKFLRLECSLSEPLSYCWFSEPNGKIHQTTNETSMALSNGPQVNTYWFGNCSIEIPEANKDKHNGTWTCHMGPASPGIEFIEEINVRIADTSLAAVEKFVFSVDDDKVIFHCKTVPHVMALNYCRFQLPIGFGIHVTEYITESNPLVQDNVRYWYNGKGLAAGDCGLVVEPATSIHNGNWTCGAKIELIPGDSESFDTIYFSYNKPHNMGLITDNTSGIVGIVFGSLGFVVALGIVIMFGIRFRETYRQHPQQAQDIGDFMQMPEELSLDTISTNASSFNRQNISRSSNNSGNSGAPVTNNFRYVVKLYTLHRWVC
ncbi:uncharacterized protein LOC105182583 isoform X2 [Harpegnathos saltator]|uniref:uncharacterized protein LOC105182583 isoform X2 n=1 Tax=Harpegnathos saltator TaxID=610380 RepID=UPI000948CBB0|nr:uncharacterized protein LOC105182583 isoform X2 [Harpegnathos saltator]